MPSKPTPPAARPSLPGRPRSETARRAILDAARELLEEGDYQSATIEAIAARSGVAKTTIYRSWPTRPALLVDVLKEVVAAAAPPPDGNDPLKALRTELRRGAAAINGLTGRLLISLLGEAQQDPEVRTALLDGLFYPRREASMRVIREAQNAGAIRSDVPAIVIVDLFFGPLFYRMFVQHEPVTEKFITQVFDQVIGGLKPKPSTAPRSTQRVRSRPSNQ